MTVFDSKTYLVRGKHSEWALITILDRSENAGTLQINSDFGSWCYSWSSMGSNIRKFLIKIHTDYLMCKLTMDNPKDGNYFYLEKTIKEIKRRIIEQRKHDSITRELARKAWDEIEEYELESINDSNHFFHTVYDDCESLFEIFGDDFPVINEYSPSIKMFCEILWPIFIEQIKEEIDE